MISEPDRRFSLFVGYVRFWANSSLNNQTESFWAALGLSGILQNTPKKFRTIAESLTTAAAAAAAAAAAIIAERSKRFRMPNERFVRLLLCACVFFVCFIF